MCIITNKKHMGNKKVLRKKSSRVSFDLIRSIYNLMHGQQMEHLKQRILSTRSVVVVGRGWWAKIFMHVKNKDRVQINVHLGRLMSPFCHSVNREITKCPPVPVLRAEPHDVWWRTCLSVELLTHYWKPIQKQWCSPCRQLVLCLWDGRATSCSDWYISAVFSWGCCTIHRRII